MSLALRRGRFHNALSRVRNSPYFTQQNLVRAAAAAGQAVDRIARARRSTRAQNVTNGSAPLTGQFDYKTDYARRRRSRRGRRRARRRYKRKRRLIRTVRDSAIAPVHLVRRSLCELTSANNESAAVSFGMYGINGTAGDSNNTTDDIASIFRQWDATSWNNSFNPLVQINDQRLWFMHATLEMTIRNTNVVGDALIEAYYIRGRQQLNTAWSSPAYVYQYGFNRQNLADGPNRDQTTNYSTFERQLAYTDIGVTPFQNAMFCKSYNIYKRQKFRIPPGGEINFVITDRRPRTFSIQQSNRTCTDRRYHGVLFQQQGPPDASGAEDTVAAPTGVTYLATRRYRFKMVRDSNVTDAFDTTGDTHGVPNPAT